MSEADACAPAQHALRIPTADGREISGTFHPAAAPRAVAVMAPALGVPSAYYADFAAALAGQGIGTLRFDYRGIGESADPARDRAVDLVDWGRLDLDAALRTAGELAGSLPLVHVGHSVGAQLLALAPNACRLRAAAFVAVSSSWHGHWRGAQALRMWLLWRVVLPPLCLGRTYFPSRRVGFSSVDVPAGVIRQWAAFARRPGYLFDPSLGIGAAPARLRCPVAHWRFADDEYGTPAACEAIASGFCAASVTVRRVPRPEGGRIGHLGFFRRERGGPLWPELAGWLLDPRPADG